jgi:hypothetical protein
MQANQERKNARVGGALYREENLTGRKSRPKTQREKPWRAQTADQFKRPAFTETKQKSLNGE